MSKFRVRADLTFDSEDDAIAFVNMVEDIKAKMYEGAPTDGIDLSLRCDYHECQHDVNPALPCSGYTNVDFKNAVKAEHKNKAGQKIVYTNLNTTPKISLSQ